MEVTSSLLVLIGLAGIVFGGALLVRHRAAERWVIKRYERLDSTDDSGDGEEQSTEPRWVPGAWSVIVLGLLSIVFGSVTIGIGIGMVT